MGKFDTVIETYKKKGVTEDNIEYSIDAIKNGTKREFILENLTADYRGMQQAEANAMLDEFYKAYGGEFKHESKGGYLIGALALVLGSLRIIFRIGDRTWDDIVKDPWDIIIVLGITILIAGYFFIKAYRGRFREKDSPID